MTFEEWLGHQGLSLSSIKKYNEAISGVISHWALSEKITSRPLDSSFSNIEFSSAAIKIRELLIYQERNIRGHGMYNSAINKFHEYLATNCFDLDNDVKSILNETNITETERINEIKCRIGQGLFRQKQIKYWNKCAVTGFDDISFLLASHIKPWSYSNNIERLDVFNGLLLTPNLDKAFDAGFITFSDQGLIFISSDFKKPEQLGINKNMKVSLKSEHLPFMAFHRENVFRK